MKLLKTAFSLGLIVMMAACADESPWKSETTSGKGGIKLTLTSSNEVNTSIPKTKATTQDIITPPSSEFKIRLAKVDGTYAKTWNSLEDFAKEDEFSVGVYELEAFYGDINSQGFVKPGEKAYEHSYYYGRIDEITVYEEQDTHVRISAGLANSIVEVDYTDAFKSYFQSWNTILKTDGKDNVVLGSNEGTCYVTPGDVDIVMDAVLENGNTIFLNPAAFEAEPQHLYKITYDVFNGEVGSAMLRVSFNDDTTIEDKFVELTDDLDSKAAPIVNTVGFDSGELFEGQVGVAMPDNKMQFEVIARGGIEKAVLSINTETKLPFTFLSNGKIDLCSASEQQQEAMVEAGIKARGFFNNQENLAFLDITDFCKTLPAGEYTISLQITDPLEQTHDVDDAVLKLNLVDTNSEIVLTNCEFGDNFADITVKYDGPDPTMNGANPFSFKLIVPRTGIENPVEIINIGSADQPLSRATYDSHTYVFRVGLPSEAADEYPVRMYFNNSKDAVDKDHSIIVKYPQYKMEYDPFALSLRMRVSECEDVAKKDKLLERLRIFLQDNDGNLNEVTDLEMDKVSGILSCKGLKSNSDYTIKTTLKIKAFKDLLDDDYMTIDPITTEEELEVPNGNFEDTTKTVSIDKITVGGQYYINAVYRQDHIWNYSSIDINEAKEWGSLNSYTCWDNGEQNKNTWYRVPGTFVNDGIYTIRTVGFSHVDTGIPESKNGVVTDYYCKNVPDEADLEKCAGELFLGTYTYNGNKNPSNEGAGVAFLSRPASLTFNYSYMPYNNDEAEVEIKLKDEKGIEIASGRNIMTSTMESNPWNFKENNFSNPKTPMTVKFSSYAFNSKPYILEIKFKSSNKEFPEIYIPTGKELDEGIKTSDYTKEEKRILPANQYHSYSKGSVLKISDLKFNYE